VANPDFVDVAVLKSWDFSAWRAEHPGQLPYRMDRLEKLGYRLHWTDRLCQNTWQRSRSASILRRAESWSAPFAQTALMARTIRSCSATMAMFESEANSLAFARNLTAASRRPPFLVISCWLAHILSTSSTLRRRGYQWAYRSVDRLYYFSKNQGEILHEALRLPAERLRYLPFGIDSETFVPSAEPDGGYVLAVGRDRGRDWRVFFEAVDGLDLPVKVCSRRSDIAGLKAPRNVEVVGYVDRETYRRLLGRACVVAVVTRPVSYPSGQSVLLEAMAMARAVVVTATPAIEDYIRDGVDCLAVPAGDPWAVRDRIGEAAADPELRSRLGAAARRVVEERYNSDEMWDVVASDLEELGVSPQR